MASHDAVFVGAGINSLAGAALLARAGWNVCVLEREDVAGGCIRTVDGLTAPGFTHELIASWHPLWTGSRRLRRAEGRARPARRRVRQHRSADRLGVPRRHGRLRLDSISPRTSPSSTRTRGRRRRLGVDVQRLHGERRPLVRPPRRSSSGRAPGSISVGRRYGGSVAADCSSSSGATLTSCRDWLVDTFSSEEAHALLAPWVLHTGLGPDQATSGFMTQVIACALQLGGMPVPRGGGDQARRRTRRRSCATPAARCAPEPTSSASSSRAAGRLRYDSPAARPCRRHARRRRERDADRALRPPARRRATCPSAVDRAPRALSLRPRRDADPHRARRAPALARGRAARARADTDRPRHDRAGRRVARRERGRARPAAGASRRSLSASRARSIRHAHPTGKWVIWLQLQELRRGHASRATRPARSTSATARGRRRSRGATPTASSAGSASLDREPGRGDARAHRPLPRRPRARERQSRRRRHLRRLVRARPEPALAAVRPRLPAIAPRSTASGTSAPARTRARVSARGSGYLVSKELTKPPVHRRVLARLPGSSIRQLVKLSLSEISTFNATFAEDVAAYAAAGFDAIGIWEFKLPDDDDGQPRAAARARARRRELRSRSSRRSCSSAIPGMEGPADPEMRIEAICASVRRFAAVRAGVRGLPHRAARRPMRPTRPRSIVVDGLRRIAAAAREAGRPARPRADPSRAARHHLVGQHRGGGRRPPRRRRSRPTSGSWPTRTTSGTTGTRQRGSRANPGPRRGHPRRRPSRRRGGPHPAPGKRARARRSSSTLCALGRLGGLARRRDLLDARRLLGAAGRRGRTPRTRGRCRAALANRLARARVERVAAVRQHRLAVRDEHALDREPSRQRA